MFGILFLLLIIICLFLVIFFFTPQQPAKNNKDMQPLTSELLQQIQQTNQPNLTEYLVPQHNIKQGNSWDCGVDVIVIIERISEKYSREMENSEIGEFDFTKKRAELRTKYLTTNE